MNNNGELSFSDFNKWLNQEDFFFGREQFSDQPKLNEFINSYWTNPTDPKIKIAKNIFITQGYETPWRGKDTINGSPTGTVTGDQALAGAVSSYIWYNNFKNETDNLYNSNFNPIEDYILSPYNFDIKDDIGVGMEGPRGSCQFQYNADPYLSLPKWSLDTLTTHEGKMGHHTQQQEWTQYLAWGTKLANTPGYVFTNGSYHEAWAVFMEWFANELNVYGSKTDFSTSEGAVPNYDENKLATLTPAMQDYQNGVYYNKVKGGVNEKSKTKNSIQLANMLAYYGFLNEAQLRNMRMALDTAYHSNTSVGSNSSLPYGSSIKQVRNYMTVNSALSIGDIKSESIRYLVMPSQATGYMLGKIEFQTMFEKVALSLYPTLTQVEANTSFIKDKNELKKFFNLCLKNGEIPIKVLKETIKNTYYPV